MPIFYGVGAPGSIGPASGGKDWWFNNLLTTSSQVLAANPARVQVVFHNPGANTIYVHPEVDANGQPLVPTLSNLGGAFMIVSGGLLTLTGEINTAWGAFGAVAGSPLTVMESNLG